MLTKSFSYELVTYPGYLLVALLKARRCAYLLTSKGVTQKAKMTREFLARKLDEYNSLRAEIDALKAEMYHDLADSPKVR